MTIPAPFDPDGFMFFVGGIVVGVLISAIMESVDERIHKWKKRKEKIPDNGLNNIIKEIKEEVQKNMEARTTLALSSQSNHKYQIPLPQPGIITIPIRRLKNGRFAKKPKGK